MKGKVLRVQLERGYAFLLGEDSISRFFHASDVVPRIAFDLLQEGQSVTFTPTSASIITGKGNGMRAIDVRPDEVVSGQ